MLARKTRRDMTANDRQARGPNVRRQREEFGGVNWGAAFLGWLVSMGIAAILIAIISAAGTAVGLTSVSSSQATKSAEPIGAGGAILLVIVLMLAYYAGGYVAGRMSRFDGGASAFGSSAW